MQQTRVIACSSILMLLGSTLLGCAGHNTAPDRSLVLLSDALSPEGRSCGVATLPIQLPTAAAIVDTVGLERALAAEFHGIVPAYAVVFSVRFTHDGQVQWVAPIHGDLPHAQQKQLQHVVARFIRGQPSAAESWSLRLRVVPGAPKQLRVGRSEICPAERIATGAPRIGSAVTTMSGEDVADLQRAGPFRVQVALGPSGNVFRVEMLQSSGSRVQDELALQAARTGKYLPALIDGIPVAAQYEVRSRR